MTFMAETLYIFFELNFLVFFIKLVKNNRANTMEVVYELHIPNNHYTIILLLYDYIAEFISFSLYI